MLFVIYIYINDPEINVSDDIICLHAGDTSLVMAGQTEDTLLNRTENAMKEAEIWFTANKRRLNTNKGEHLDFSLNIKILSLYANSKLIWTVYIDELSKRPAAAVDTVQRIKKYLHSLGSIEQYISLIFIALLSTVYSLGVCPRMLAVSLLY